MIGADQVLHGARTLSRSTFQSLITSRERRQSGNEYVPCPSTFRPSFSMTNDVQAILGTGRVGGSTGTVARLASRSSAEYVQGGYLGHQRLAELEPQRSEPLEYVRHVFKIAAHLTAVVRTDYPLNYAIMPFTPEWFRPSPRAAFFLSPMLFALRPPSSAPKGRTPTSSSPLRS